MPFSRIQQAILSRCVVALPPRASQLYAVSTRQSMHSFQYPTQWSIVSIQCFIIWLLPPYLWVSATPDFPRSQGVLSLKHLFIWCILGLVFPVKGHLTQTFHPRLICLRAAGHCTCKLCASVKRWNRNEPQLVWLTQQYGLSTIESYPSHCWCSEL